MYGYGYQNSGILKSGGAAVGPVNSVAPVISGTAERGETLSSTTGTWSGVGTITYSRQWKRDGLDIFGATSTTYVLVEADDNTFVTCLVTATDSEGSRSKISNTLGAVLGLPLNLTAPVLSGTPTIGEVLSTTDGTWQGKATITFTYQWRRDLANIGGATSNTYTLADADYQTTIDCVVTATNTFGSAAQDSNDSALIAGITPSISGVPTFAGTEQVGETLTATATSTLGRPIPSRTWKWQISNDGVSGWADISGATSITYLLDAADENKYVRVVQIETNGVGSDSANSAASGQIAAIPSFTGLLDTYPSAAAAYSLRQLRTAYSGDAIRVRRASDNTELNIGFVANELDTSSLTTFASGTDAFVTTWYDQSGSSINLLQTTATLQPKIVSSGSVITQGSKSAIEFLGGQLIGNTFATKSQPISIFATSKNSSASFGGAFGDNLQQANRVGVGYYFIASGVGNVTVDAENSNNIITSFIANGSSSKTRINNGTQLTGDAATQTQGGLFIGGGSYFGYMTGFFQEYVQWDSNQLSNEVGIRTNMNDYYGIY